MRDNQASSTATLIARSLVLVARDPRHARLVSAIAITTSLACLEAQRLNAGWWWGACARPWFRRAQAWLERLTLPGITLHYALRKRRIAEAVEAAMAGGARQLVVLAAGFDALARRTALRH